MIRWCAYITLGGLGMLMMASFFSGLFVQRWAPFWFGQNHTIILETGNTPAVDIGDLPLAPVLGPKPLVSDTERYQLARAAGFTPDEAITATAISIAENGGGNPAALSGRNTNNTYDLGLWQINSVHWAVYGGQQALIDPLNNARAAHGIYVASGWCAWSTYDARCGPGHTGSYAANLSRARAASLP